MIEFEPEDRQRVLDNYEVYVKDDQGRPTKTVNCVRLGKLLLNGDDRRYMVMQDNQEVFYYNGGYWEQGGEAVVKHRANFYLGEDLTDHRLKEVMAYIKTHGYVDREDLDRDINLIPFKNGCLDISTMGFGPHKPENLVTSGLPVEYDPSATCPLWEKFLDDVLYLEDRNFIQEYIGYMFYRRYTWAVLVITLGHGRNGKSTFNAVIKELFGKENVSTVPIQQLTVDRFSSSNLYRRWANICSDLSSMDLKDISIIKQLTGGDSIYAQKKHRDPFSFVNYAKLLFASNELPEVKEKTLAATERFAIIEFPNTFERGSEGCDPDIGTKLLAELPGIANWALKGLRRLLDTKRWSPFRNFENVREYYKESKEPVNLFGKQHVRGKTGSKIAKGDLHARYLRFAQKNGHPTIASNQFTKKLKEYLDKAGIVYTEGQSTDRVWYGIEYYDEEEGCQKSDDPNGQTTLNDPVVTVEEPPVDDIPEWTELEIAAGVDKIQGRDPQKVQREVDDE
jgi:putative DNA primase/helicase